jgi:hypothetical protein
VADSILNDVKKMLNVGATDTAFDLDITININAAFSVLTQLGLGPEEGFIIEDDTVTWDAFIGDDRRLYFVKVYIYQKVRLVFDPPSTSFAIDAVKEQIRELEWRLNVHREGESWVDPNPPVVTTP